MARQRLPRDLPESGFTLIELLVVIAVIGILASVIIAPVQSARAKARDAKRLADKRTVITALHLVYDATGSWPSTNQNWVCVAPAEESCFASLYLRGYDPLVTALSPYLTMLPVTNAARETNAYNRFVYTNYLPGWTDSNGAHPGGAYLIWPQEVEMSDQECAPAFRYRLDAYWYCYEYVGPP